MADKLWNFDDDSFYEYGISMINKVVIAKATGRKYKIFKQHNDKMWEAVSLDIHKVHQIVMSQSLTTGMFYQENA